MADASVTRHYGRAGLIDEILLALREAGLDPDNLQPADLAPLDQFHSRGRAATEDVFAEFGVVEGGHVLDVGSGIGGPARFLAGKGLKVTGVDLTPEFVQVARELTRRTMPVAPVEFVNASATSLPMADGAFDGAWMQHVSMNIESKEELFAELARVVRPGGRLAAHEVIAGPGGAAYLPAPWASAEGSSFLVREDAIREVLESAGWRIVAWRDDTPATLEFIAGLVARLDSLPRLSLRLLLGDRFAECFVNYARSLREDRCRIVIAIAERPSVAVWLVNP
ncbi:MAG: class I SAM-dependent methyltransferase [Fimbriimonadaceae bacterium]